MVEGMSCAIGAGRHELGGLKLGGPAIRYPAVVPPSWLWRAQVTPAILAGRLVHVDVGEDVEHFTIRFAWCPELD